MKLAFRWIDEARPGPRWRGLFERAWPAYRSWFLQDGDDARPALDECRAQLSAHMPEIVGLWDELTRLAGGDEQVARMLSLVDPAPYVTGCSQAVRTGRSPLLARNYDYRPDACEGVFLKTRWHATTVLAASDCLWGVLDGINEHGLCVALSFGGSRRVGPGFGIPLILRYVLEFCTDVDEAAAVLRRVPSHMAYNVSLLDARGGHAVAYLAPGRRPEVVPERVSTNHQRPIEWSEYADMTRSQERLDFLRAQLDKRQSAERFVERFLEPPLYVDGYDRGYGTLYTAVYRPKERSAEYLWPHMRVRQTLDTFVETEVPIDFGAKPAVDAFAEVAEPEGP